MNTTELLTQFRAEVFDTAEPYLWSSALIYTYIDDAQKQFCRLTYGIEDARSFKVSIKDDGTEWYAIDPMILKIRDAITVSTGDTMPLIAVEKMAQHGMKFDGRVGPTRALITGLEKGYVRAHPKPNFSSVVELRVFRLPNDVVAGDDLEIDAHHHINLLDWVKKRAYSIPDTDTYDPQKAAKHEQAFNLYCAAAKVEQSRARRPVSTVSYGGL